jgi:hypothetical protein
VTMPKRRTDPASFDLAHPCPDCGYKILPSEIMVFGLDPADTLGKGINIGIAVIAARQPARSRIVERKRPCGLAMDSTSPNKVLMLEPFA